MKRIIFSAVICVYITSLIDAQTGQPSIQPLVDIVGRVQAMYGTNPNLSFHVLYTFADEATPQNIEDSIQGFIQVSDNRYHVKIGPTETICDGTYGITLFSEDKVMYITQSSKIIGQIDPFARLDSALLAIKGLQTSVNDDVGIETVKIDFPPDNMYKSIWISIDKKTGFLKTVQFTIKDQALPIGQIPDAAQMQSQSGYAIIRANYFDYNNDTVSDAVFNASRYFTKSDKKFSTTEEFKDYQIFIGSPNL